MDDPVTVEEVNTGEDLPHDVFDSLRSQTGWGTLLYVEVEILVDVLEDEVENHLAVPRVPLPMADVHQAHDVRVAVLPW